VGHERLGVLPKSKAWRLIVAEMAGFALGSSEIYSIAKNTLQQVQKQFSNLENDPSIKSAFEFLLQVSYAFQKNDPIGYLTENKILSSEELSALKLARAINNYKKEEVVSKEYQTFARQAAIDAINNWYYSNLDKGQTLFSEGIDSEAILRKAADGSGFCEISRIYFSKFTERYLKYFLEREASSVITNLNDRKKFNDELEKHISQISKHAFETSKITQSFAAGWFNKNVKESYPEENKIKGFLSYALGKMKGELLQEEYN
jgi:hypothetical protein